MATNGLAPATPPGPSRSPSVNSAAEQVSDRDVAMDDDDSVGDSDSEGDRDDPTASSISLSITLPALATPKASSSSHPWPFTSVNQLSPTLSQHAPSMHEPPPAVPASSLPHEILLHILRLLPAESQAPALRVCKAWCQCGVELLWHKPSFSSMARLWKMIRVINSPDQTFPYRRFIRRLNFSSMHEHMTDDFILQLGQCERLERLTLAGCKLVGSEALVTLLSKTKRLIALDLSDMPGASDDVARTIAQSCPRLQGLNLSGCKGLTDRGLEAVARSCFELRRIKLRNIENLSDTPVILLSLNCPLLLEVDLVCCSRITSLSLLQLFRTSHSLRELSLLGCVEINDSGFPSREMVMNLARRGLPADDPSDEPPEPSDPLAATDGSLVPRPNPLYYAPHMKMMDHLRYLDLTSLNSLTDDAIEGIVKYMPKIRNLILAKCTRLTDESVYSICQLGKHLHYLHLGHVSLITDSAVKTLARCCTRLRYIDLANCQRLTDMSVFELATNLPRMKRIGLVRVANITDQAIYALHARTSLERIHLSYCEHISVQAIHELLEKLSRLTHLSLTGVPAFRRDDLQMYCRSPPREFNSHQRATFCVYSGKGVQNLRMKLRSLQETTDQDEAQAAAGLGVSALPRTNAPHLGARNGHRGPRVLPQLPPALGNVAADTRGRVGPGAPIAPGENHQRNRRGPTDPRTASASHSASDVQVALHGATTHQFPPPGSRNVHIQLVPPIHGDGASPSTSTGPGWRDIDRPVMHADGWLWNPRTHTGSYVGTGTNGESSASSASSSRSGSAAGLGDQRAAVQDASLRLRGDAGFDADGSEDVPGLSSGAMPVAGRQRRDTVTRGNFRGMNNGPTGVDDDMQDRSDGDEDVSLEEGDIEMA